MGVNSLPKTVTRQRRDCDLNPGPTAPESSTLATRLPSHPDTSGSTTKTAKRIELVFGVEAPFSLLYTVMSDNFGGHLPLELCPELWT